MNTRKGQSRGHRRCCTAHCVVGDDIYVGTDDARVLRLGGTGKLLPLGGFDAVAGCDRWYAGSAVVDGQVVGPPLGIRSMSGTADGRVIFANVHVGGIPRSMDRGVTWQPTVNVDSDVHEVRAHPNRPLIVAAATAIGVYVSRDAGATWLLDKKGLHAMYCSAVAFTDDEILVAASEDHFAAKGMVYRRPIDGQESFKPVENGLPVWTDGIVDSGCIAVNNGALAVADNSGNLYLCTSVDSAWSRHANNIPGPSSLLINRVPQPLS